MNIEIAQLMNQALEKKAVPGISYSLMGNKNNEEHYLGFKTYDYDENIRPNLRYDLASLTKVVGTTTRILQLLGNKELNLDDDVNDFFPDTVFKQVKIRNLLLHNSGLQPDLENVFQYKSADEVWQAVKHTPASYKINSKCVYSDLNFIILGKIIEHIDRVSLDETIKQNVLIPIGMNDSGYCLNLSKTDFVPTEYREGVGLICGIVHDETATVLNGVSGHAGLFSTLEDLQKFAKMYLNRGYADNKEVIPSKMINLLFKYDVFGRTLGWIRWTPDSKKLWHTGFTGTGLGIDLDTNSAFIVLSNNICPTRKNRKWLPLRWHAAETFFGCENTEN